MTPEELPILLEFKMCINKNKVPLVIAAVKVVFPWSTWPIVPTLQCGFVLSNTSFSA